MRFCRNLSIFYDLSVETKLNEKKNYKQFPSELKEYRKKHTMTHVCETIFLWGNFVWMMAY